MSPGNCSSKEAVFDKIFEANGQSGLIWAGLTVPCREFVDGIAVFDQYLFSKSTIRSAIWG